MSASTTSEGVRASGECEPLLDPGNVGPTELQSDQEITDQFRVHDFFPPFSSKQD